MEPLRCFDCGTPLSDVRELFVTMRELYLADSVTHRNVHIEKVRFVPEAGDNILPVFEALHAGEYCCRKAHATTAIMSEL